MEQQQRVWGAGTGQGTWWGRGGSTGLDTLHNAAAVARVTVAAVAQVTVASVGAKRVTIRNWKACEQWAHHRDLKRAINWNFYQLGESQTYVKHASHTQM